MTRPNPTRKPVGCPNCRARIKSLYYVAHQSISGEFSLASGHEDNLGADRDRIEYSCPVCGAEFFAVEALAEAFLLAQIVRPTRRKKRG